MRIPFESTVRNLFRALRRESKEEGPSLQGFLNDDGVVEPQKGDELGPYVHAIGRASSDASTGITTVADGDPQRLATDLNGVLWTTPAVAGVQKVEGDIAHDVADTITQNPVNIGGHANAALPAAVAEDDRVRASFDLQGQLRTRAMGNVDHDAADSGSPVLVGGHANAAAPAAVGENDRVRASYDLVGRARVIASGDVANDDPSSGNPVLVGGVAQTLVQAAVAALDRVQLAATLLGQLHTIPFPLVEDEVALLGTWAAPVACAAAGAKTRTGIVDVRYARRIALRMKYVPGAAGGYPHVIVFTSAAAASPAVADDGWMPLGDNDGQSTAAVLTGALPAGADYTLTPEWSIRTYRPLVVRTEAGDNATDAIPMKLVFDLTDDKWLHVVYCEVGVTATPGSLAIYYNLSR